MKIIGINASPKGNASNTLKLVNSVLKDAGSEGAETELIDLYKMNLEYCIGCGACCAIGKCSLFDDFVEIFGRL
jgi:multimeric flavodoxin WrbA